MSRLPVIHGPAHPWFGSDPVVGRWFYVGTAGVDGVDAQLADNPPPYETGGVDGPPPFQNSWTNLFSGGGDGLRYRWAPHGIQIDCGGGITGGTDNTVITTLVGVPLPDTPKAGVDSFVDGSGIFMWSLSPAGDLTYLTGIAP